MIVLICAHLSNFDFSLVQCKLGRVQPCANVRVVKVRPVVVGDLFLNDRRQSNLVQGDVHCLESCATAFGVFLRDSVVWCRRCRSELCKLRGLAGVDLRKGMLVTRG